MGRAKVIYLDEYRKAGQYRNLLHLIEGHLAEARLLAKDSFVGCRSCQSIDSEECLQLSGVDCGLGDKDL